MKLQATPVLKKNKAEGLILPNFKINYRAAAIKTALAQEKHADQQDRDRSECARLRPVGKGTKAAQLGKIRVFNRWRGDNWVSPCKKDEGGPPPHTTDKNQEIKHLKL